MIHRPRGLAAGALALAVLGALVGCVGSTPVKSPTPTPNAAPLYSSDAKALAAASAAYQQYMKASNEVAHGGWTDISPLKKIVEGDALKAETEAARKNSANGIHTSGDATGKVVQVQKITSSYVTTYTCFDVSGTRVINAQGEDVTSPKRTEVVPFQVRFGPRGASLVLERSDVWSGDSFC